MDKRLNSLAVILFIGILFCFLPISSSPNIFLNTISTPSDDASFNKTIDSLIKYKVLEVTIQPTTINVFTDCWTRFSFKQDIKHTVVSRVFWVKKCLNPNLTNIKYTFKGNSVLIQRPILTNFRNYPVEYLNSNLIYPLASAKKNFNAKH